MRWLLVLLMLLLAGCAGTGPSQPVDEPGPSSEGPLDPDESVRHEVDNRAVAMLWDQAEQARREDRTGDAVAALERALRLAPEDPVLWSRLAEMRLRQQDFAVAENLAAKSNALAGDRRLLRYRNWLLIAEARARRGDSSGAQSAREKAEGLRSGQARVPAAPAVPPRAAESARANRVASVSTADPDSGRQPGAVARAEFAAFEVEPASGDGGGIDIPPGYQLITPDGLGRMPARTTAGPDNGADDGAEASAQGRPASADPDRGAAGEWSVQTASLRDARNAQSMRDRLRRAGYPAFIRVATVDGRRFHRVRVGPVESRDAARSLSAELRERGGPGAMVVRDAGPDASGTASAAR